MYDACEDYTAYFDWAIIQSSAQPSNRLKMPVLVDGACVLLIE